MGILGLLFPDRCVFCGKILKNGRVCAECERALPYTEGVRTSKRGEFFTECVSPFYYRGIVRDSILRFKFGGRGMYAEVYAKYCARAVNELLNGRFDLITWVPVSKKRLRKRGYDQARLIGEALANELSIPCRVTLEKIRDTAAQSTLEGEARRRANISGAYRTVGDGLGGKRILIVDDLITTGATMNECARTLLMSGVEEVAGCTVARSK